MKVKTSNKMALFIFVILFLNSCISTPEIRNNIDSTKYQYIDFDNIYSFIDTIINNNKNIDSTIKKSIYYDIDYSFLKFMNYRFSDYFNNLKDSGYEIDEIDYFNISEQDKFEHIDQAQRYPDWDGIERKQVLHILNIYINKHNQKRDMTNNNGAVVFTFCQRKDKTWYLRGVDFEYVIY